MKHYFYLKLILKEEKDWFVDMTTLLLDTKYTLILK